MEQKESLCLDNKVILPILETLMSIVVDEKKRNRESIENLSNQLNSIYSTYYLDKKKLVSRWVQLSGEDAFKVLQSATDEEFYRVLPVILKSSAEYLNKTCDYLYLLAELSIATDWCLYQSIDLGTN